MLCKRIIPCLDLRDGRVVKGINFVNIKDAGDPVELCTKYAREGADEIVLLDINASWKEKSPSIETIDKITDNVFVPITVGGGINTVEDMKSILRAGADKISINSSAVRNPELISEGAKYFGSQCIVVAIDAKKIGDDYFVFVKGGRENTGLNAVEWAKKAEELGAGEILLTSMETDGVRNGFDLDITKRIADSVNIPIIASGGAGEFVHFKEAAEIGADGLLAASLFHYEIMSINSVKQYLKKEGIEVRL
jgi:cyclase